MNKRLLCWILAFSLAFQPLIFEGISWAGAETTVAPPADGSAGSSPDSGAGTTLPEGTTAADQAKKAEEAQKKFDETYESLMKTEEIKNPSNSGGIGGFFKKAALWVTGNKGNVDKAVNDANAELKKAKEEMTKMKAELAAGVASAKDAALQNAQATMQKNLELSAKLQTAISVSMKKIGDFMATLSGTLKTVASTLQKVAVGVAAIPAVGTAISAVLFGVSKVLGGVSGVVGAVGKSMIAFSQKADLSAKDFLGMVSDAKNGWKEGAKGFGRPKPAPLPATQLNPGLVTLPDGPGQSGLLPGNAAPSVNPDGTLVSTPIGNPDGAVGAQNLSLPGSPGENTAPLRSRPIAGMDDSLPGNPKPSGKLAFASYSPPTTEATQPAAPGTGDNSSNPTIIANAQGYLQDVASKIGLKTTISRNGKMDAATVDAIKKFQTYYLLKPTGKLDGETLKILANSAALAAIEQGGGGLAAEKKITTDIGNKVLEDARIFQIANKDVTGHGAFFHAGVTIDLPREAEDLRNVIKSGNVKQIQEATARVDQLIKGLDKYRNNEQQIVNVAYVTARGAEAAGKGAAELLTLIPGAGQVAGPLLKGAYTAVEKMQDPKTWEKGNLNGAAVMLTAATTEVVAVKLGEKVGGGLGGKILDQQVKELVETFSSKVSSAAMAKGIEVMVKAAQSGKKPTREELSKACAEAAIIAGMELGAHYATVGISNSKFQEALRNMGFQIGEQLSANLGGQ